MFAELRPPLRSHRLIGAATTLIVLALLAFALSRPPEPSPAEPEPEPVTVFLTKPETPPAVLPVMPLQNVDLPLPMILVNLPEFERPPAPPALASAAPTVSPEAAPAPSGNRTALGVPDGTAQTGAGKAGGGGPVFLPPVRTGGAGMPFDLKSASRAGRVTSLNFCVNQDGRTSHVHLAAGSGFSDMDRIAMDWLAQQRFAPGTFDGVQVRMCATYDIRWSYSQATSFEARDAAKAHAETIRRRSRYPRQFVYWPQDTAFPGCDAVNVCKTTVD